MQYGTNTPDTAENQWLQMEKGFIYPEIFKNRFGVMHECDKNKFQNHPLTMICMGKC